MDRTLCKFSGYLIVRVFKQYEMGVKYFLDE